MKKFALGKAGALEKLDFKSSFIIMQSLKITVKINNFSRAFDAPTLQESQRLFRRDLQTIRDLQTTFGEFDFHHPECKSISWDFSNLISRTNANTSALEEIYEGLLSGRKVDYAYEKFLHDPIKITGHAIYSEGDHFPQSLASSFLHDIFLVANLSNPGCLSLHNTEIECKNKKFKSYLDLSSYIFDFAATDASAREEFKLSFYDLLSVKKWYFSFREPLSHYPGSSLEKAVFALLHICSDGHKEIHAIWIFYALESLLETSVGENQRALFERICLVLELDETTRKPLKKELRNLYSLRSSIVHGGREIMHPDWQGEIDRRVLDRYTEFSNTIHFGATIVIKLIQVLIHNHSTGFSFSTSVSFDKVP